MARKRNPRRIAQAIIKAMSDNVTAMHRTWGKPKHVVDGNSYVLATGDAKTENSVEQWTRLAEFMAVIEEQARGTRIFAEDMAVRVQNGERF